MMMKVLASIPNLSREINSGAFAQNVCLDPTNQRIIDQGMTPAQNRKNFSLVSYKDKLVNQYRLETKELR